MLTNQQVGGVQRAIRELVPGAQVTVESVPRKTFKKRAGAAITGIETLRTGEVRFWFDVTRESVCVMRIERPSVKLTRAEKEILRHLPLAIEGLLLSADQRALRLAQRIASRLSFELILLARFLRGRRATTYWTTAQVLLLLQDLTFERYENEPCTSGFVHTSSPAAYLKKAVKQGWEVLAFEKTLPLADDVFASPASYRYVDGRNAFYVVDNKGRLHGVLRQSRPRQYSIVDRAWAGHLDPLVEQMPGRPWVAYVGMNDDVNVHMTGGVHFRWEKNHWKMRDRNLLVRMITRRGGFDPKRAPRLAAVLTTLSELRLGCAILIAEDKSARPSIVGAIDVSSVGRALQDALVGRSFRSLVESHQAIGVLSSDGLTTVSRDGTVLGCGEIIELEVGAHLAGGGRTQASRTASKYGLSIKVSEDGPISLFHGGELALSL